MGLVEADKKLKQSLAKAKETAEEIKPVQCTIHTSELDPECDMCIQSIADFLSHSYLTTNIEQIERDNDTLNSFIEFCETDGKVNGLDKFLKLSSKK